MNSAIPTRPQLESLEHRWMLAGDTECAINLDDLPSDGFARATRAINCFALDLYPHYEAEQGNLFLSPFSISTALTMAYAGAVGETAAEMEEVLHLGTEPGIHEAFDALFGTLAGRGEAYVLESANALWPQIGAGIKQSYLDLIAESYEGYAQPLDYSGDLEGSRATINQWVEQQTHGLVKDLVRRLSPDTVMVLTNALFYRALWSTPFAPDLTADHEFLLEDGGSRTVPMMLMPAYSLATDANGMLLPSLGYGYAEHGDFRVLEVPFQEGKSSMVILLPKDGHTTEDLTTETLADVMRWQPTERREDLEVRIPKFEMTLATKLEELLPAMGMEHAFGDADFSNMLAGVWIDQVGHKATLEVNEQGTEAAAATFVSLVVCFAAGTKVLTPDGEKRIEEIQPGDLVLSRDEHDVRGKIEAKVVEETFQNRGQLLGLQIEDNQLRVTPEHPFFVDQQGWTKAKDLRPGDRLACDTRSWKTLDRVVSLEGQHDVYNFRVAQHHTYFVGGRDFGFAVWTHNACGEPDPQFTVDRPFHFFIRDNTTSTVLFLGRISDPTLESPDEEIMLQYHEDDESNRLAGDANGDEVVDFEDFVILSANFGKTTDAVFAEGDFNNDNAVTFADFLILAAQYGQQRSPLE